MKLTIGGRPVQASDPANTFHTSADLPEPPLPRTAEEIEAAPPDAGPCPCCGRPRPNPVNTFATGSQGAVPVPVREPDDGEPDPTQFTNHRKG